MGRSEVGTLAQRDRLLEELKHLPIDMIVERERAAASRLGLAADPKAREEFLDWDQRSGRCNVCTWVGQRARSW